MKVKESFAVKATPKVRKDPRFEWYVNWLKSLENCKNLNNDIDYIFLGITAMYKFVNNLPSIDSFDKILTLDEVYSRYGKEIYEANGIELNTKRGSVVYLGKYKWADAIEYAQSLGLFVPKYDEMIELVKHFKRSNDYCSFGVYGTSTTYPYDTLCQVTFPKQKEPITKDIPLDVYGITEMTRADIQLGNFEIFYSVEEWKGANGIEQPFQGSREYDEKLLEERTKFLSNKVGCAGYILRHYDEDFLDNRYGNYSILKQIAEHKAKIEELKKKLR